MEQDILLDKDNDLLIRNGDFVIDESLTQDITILLGLNQGELKSDPLLGPGLIRLINSNVSDDELKAKIKLHLQRDNKNYEAIKDYITLNTNKT